MSEEAVTLYVGTLIDAPERGTLRVRKNRMLAVNGAGLIVADLVSAGSTNSERQEGIKPLDDIASSLKTAVLSALQDGRVVELTQSQFLMPGLVDCHLHAPQYSYTGTGLDLPLMGPEGWLEQYTFPAEKRMVEDLARARSQSQAVVRSTLRHGTTTALYFGTLHLEPCKVLADVADSLGQRALIGKVCMDRNSPDDYSASAAQNVTETEALLDYCEKSCSGRIEGVITPRFVPTCSVDLMQQLGKLAAKKGCRVQTHVAESADEVAFCKALHPDVPRDTTLLDQCGLLPRSVMAHGVHLSDEEFKLIASRGGGVAHCPLSNAYFANSIFRTRAALDLGVHVGLGTDIAGGYDPSMLSAMRSAVWASRILESGSAEFDWGEGTPQITAEAPRNFPGARLSIPDALWLATMGGAGALGLEEKIGSLDIGKEFDASIVDLTCPDSRLDIFPEEGDGDRFEKFFHNGDDRNIVAVFVQGHRVLHRAATGLSFSADD